MSTRAAGSHPPVNDSAPATVSPRAVRIWTRCRARRVISPRVESAVDVSSGMANVTIRDAGWRREPNDARLVPLREHRQARGLTLRGLSALAAVSPGYLSEIERGTKEASSELLASVCAALGVPLSDVLATLSVRVAEVEALTSPVLVPMPAPLAPVSASAA